MFPVPKKVAFKAQLTEDIKTTKYTLRHSDIESSDSEEEVTPSQDVGAKAIVDQPEPKPSRGLKLNTTTSPQVGDKRESDDEGEEEGDMPPVTPVAGRRKRHRQWRWTLGPISPNFGGEKEVETEDQKTLAQ